MSRLIRVRRLGFVAVLLVAAAGPPGVAYGAALTTTNRQLASGSASVTGCGVSTAPIGWTIRGDTTVMALEVTGLSSCVGATATFTYTSSTNTLVARSGTASTVVVSSGGVATFPQLYASDGTTVVTPSIQSSGRVHLSVVVP